MLFWRREPGSAWARWGEDQPVWVLAAVALQPIIATVAAWIAIRRIRSRLRRGVGDLHDAQHAHHVVTIVLRFVLMGAFAATLFLTPWPDWLRIGGAYGMWLQLFGDVAIISPLLLGIIGIWSAAFPLERDIRAESLRDGATWRFGSYLDFNIRHHILVVAVPLLIILFVYNVADGYERQLQRATGVVWAVEAVLGAAACVVFAIAPMLLRRIWHTHSLPSGQLRDRLEAMCSRIGLRCRDILIWRSDGMVVNAAVMGILPRVRYVMLSDGLLATMSPEQVEGVFGHEAGHVRHRHIQHFLLFAFVGWLVATGIMELALRLGGTSTLSADNGVSFMGAQALGIGVTIVFWALGFGWISRRFERQADMFGAMCVAPPAAGCTVPCSVHLEGSAAPLPAQAEAAAATGPVRGHGRLCASGAAVFASALDRVAILNGIPHDERSWRHSSIESRIRHLSKLAGDPTEAERFDRVILRIKIGLVVLSVLGAAATLGYLTMYQPLLTKG
jgi:STE24 endopeptidase